MQPPMDGLRSASPSRQPASQPLTIQGTLRRVVYASREDGWCVVRITVPGQSEPMTAVGNLLGVRPGEDLRLTGQWVTDRRYGRQFKVSSYLTVAPSTLLGMERYLGSGLVKGIGPVMARRLVKRFGLETLDVIESQPQRLAEVEGIGPLRSRRIQAAWSAQRQVREVMVFLQSHGISASHATRIYKQYGARSVAMVRENPYVLATDIHGIGFLTADQIAANLGVSRTSPRRIEAGVLHILDGMAGQGHLRAPRSLLKEESSRLLEVQPEQVDAALDRLQEQGELVFSRRPGTQEPDVYRSFLHAAESGFATLLMTLLTTPSRAVPIDAEKAMTWLEQRQKLHLAPGQREAIRRGLESKVLIITGGPGTGKTTLIKGLIKILEAKGTRILLGAPTGRAAGRLAETTGRPARTNHRLLERNPQKQGFQRNARRPLEADLLIVDEASMIDQVLGYRILQALPCSCRLIMVGDVDQLPSVGPGQVLADMIRSHRIDVVCLTEIFRQSGHSKIAINAHKVNRGEMPISSRQEEAADFFIIRREEPEEILATIKDLLSGRLRRRFDLDPMTEIQVLTPMNRGLLGTFNLNTELQALLNPQEEILQHGNRRLGMGDKVMQIHNNYDLEVFNGEIGQVTAVHRESVSVEVDFDGRRVVYTPAEVDELALAYACSIHKSQGNEYPGVIIPLHTQHYMMLQRNLLYTAISRGRQLVILVASPRALALAVKNDRVQERFTGLAWRLRTCPSVP
ncbi:MAG: ATP-dependent RecD-like DNA helicase [Acidobacteriota bacterium]